MVRLLINDATHFIRDRYIIGIKQYKDTYHVMLSKEARLGSSAPISKQQYYAIKRSMAYESS